LRLRVSERVPDRRAPRIVRLLTVLRYTYKEQSMYVRMRNARICSLRGLGGDEPGVSRVKGRY